jgi:hypothetical protein
MVDENRFESEFSGYCCEGDSIECEVTGLTVVARIIRDSDSHIDDDDCHNLDQGVTGCDAEQQKTLLATRKAWFADEWFYCGIDLSVYIGATPLAEHAASLWSIECNYPGTDNSYLTEVANELLPEAIEAGRDAAIELERRLRERVVTV